MDVLIDGVSAAQYHAILLRYTIRPARVEVYTDWMRNSPNPLLYGSQKKYVEINMTLLVENTDADSVQTDISNLSNALVQSKLKFSDRKTYYDAWTASDAEPTLVNPRTYQYDITLNATYGYLPAVSQTLSGQAGTITAQGNLPSPAVVTLTPTQDIGEVTLTGLTKRPIVVHNLHAGAPVVIDGKGIVTEADLDSVMTESMGAGKWLYKKYSIANFFSPESYSPDHVPVPLDIPDNAAYMQSLLTDATDLVKNAGYDYLGYLKTAVHVGASKSVTWHIKHDDGCSIYVNGSQVYSCGVDVVDGSAVASFTLAAGWNTIEVYWIQHYGPDGFYGLSPLLGSVGDALNCYHARNALSPSEANKFPDTDLWSFPVLQPGDNPISIDSAVCGVKVEYNPKFM